MVQNHVQKLKIINFLKGLICLELNKGSILELLKIKGLIHNQKIS